MWKYIDGDIIYYYVNKKLYDDAVNSKSSYFKLTLSNFALQNGEIIKNRYGSIENLLDNLFGVVEISINL